MKETREQRRAGLEVASKLSVDELRYYLNMLIPSEWTAEDLRRRYGSPEYV